MASNNDLLGKERGKAPNMEPPPPRHDPRVLPEGIQMYHSDHPPQMVYRTDTKANMEAKGWSENYIPYVPKPEPEVKSEKKVEEKGGVKGLEVKVPDDKVKK